MLKTVFIGAGRRAQSAHYPTVSRIENSKISAVSELDESRMGEVVDKYNIPETFGDYREMVESVDPDIVYVVMGQEYMTQIAIDCMNAASTFSSKNRPEVALQNLVNFSRQQSPIT